MRMTDLYAFGARTEIGTYTFDEENIVRFARRFDPQPFHIDPEAARRSLFGGLCASGWHTCAVWMRSFVDYWSTETARLKSKGLPRPASRSCNG
jgi:acyl dehydratase